MGEVHDRVREKVMEFFTQCMGDRAKLLDGSVVATPAMDAAGAALTPEFGVDKAREIAFHMADWNSDAAFIVALHLVPERFTQEEIAAGIGLFLNHAPNHIRAACVLTGVYV